MRARRPARRPGDRPYRTVRDASDTADIDAVFVQIPLPGGVDEGRVRRLIDPAKDADGFHPENVVTLAKRRA